MTKREWRLSRTGEFFVTGDTDVGAMVGRHDTAVGERWWMQAKFGAVRRATDDGNETQDAAMMAAERWLDEREAERQE